MSLLPKTFRRVVCFPQRVSSPSLVRWNSTNGVPKPPLKLVAELRKHTDVSISKAREALIASNLDIAKAVQWLEQDLATSGVKKAGKLSDRIAKEGLVSLSVLSRGLGDPPHRSPRAALVELNCETDFVARNSLFAQLAEDIAHTAAFISEAPSNGEPSFLTLNLDAFVDAPLLSSKPDSSLTSSLTIRESILDIISKVGENIVLRRVGALVTKPITSASEGYCVAGHAHGLSPTQGRIGTLALLRLQAPTLVEALKRETFSPGLDRLSRALARQIVGMNPSQIRAAPSSDESEQTALYNQPFMMYGEESQVEAVLRRWSQEHGLSEGGVDVIEFSRWELGS
ncbi:EF-TsMt 2 [Flagelloscypha sp. PMI_526]|nr:EF-TsMt 2 [Flagelloscypha sp. PMI_526]